MEYICFKGYVEYQLSLYSNNNTNHNMKCKKCEYEWKTRLKNPKSCPRCKRRFDYKMGEIRV